MKLYPIFPIFDRNLKKAPKITRKIIPPSTGIRIILPNTIREESNISKNFFIALLG